MKRFFDKPWFYKILALLLAILLAIYINNNQQGFAPKGQRNQTIKTATRKETLKVPLQVSVNTDKYYVTGYPEKVSLTISGSSALVTSTMNTQNFRAFIDLSRLKTGTHKVPVKINGLSNQLAYSIEPKTVRVTIQDRKSKSFPVQIEYNKGAVPDGYQIGTATSDPSVINVTGSKSEVNQIDRIVARIILPKGQTETYNREVMLIAEDKDGRQLNVVMDPATTHVHVPIHLPSKKVKVNVTSHNESQNRIYSLTANHSSVRLYGKASVLKKLNEVSLDVNLDNISSTTTKKVNLVLPKGIVKADPSEFTVKIRVSESMNSVKKE
ncbi:CdaR family protein [Lactobacillus hominis]|uniref:CdaR family protein n=1 Tax=Lactobacillus hominis TaxID=1203033 RepID=UPI0023F358DF|nr:CdaR family protein [Lactobacillus hominis]